MKSQKAEDYLRKEYFQLLPKMTKILLLLETRIKWYLRNNNYGLTSYQRITVESRIKECESAINSLLNKQQFCAFRDDTKYTLKQLKDLIGVRILVFPSNLLEEVNNTIISKLPHWESDPELVGEVKILKYRGFVERNKTIKCEIQIVPMLTGLFWEVEHFVLYKPQPQYKNTKSDPDMKKYYREVLNTFVKFEKAFEKVISKK